MGKIRTITTKKGISIDVVPPGYNIIEGVELVGPPVPVYVKKDLGPIGQSSSISILGGDFYKKGCFEEALEKAVDALDIIVYPADCAIPSPTLIHHAKKETDYKQAFQFVKRNIGGFSAAEANPLQFDDCIKESLPLYKGDLEGIAGVVVFSKDINLSEYFETPKIPDIWVYDGIGRELFMDLFLEDVADSAGKIECLKNVTVKAIAPSSLVPIMKFVKFEDRRQVHDPEGHLLLGVSYLV